MPAFLPQLFDPDNFGRFEFIRLVSGLPFEGGNHFMFMENPEKFNRVVREFMG